MFPQVYKNLHRNTKSIIKEGIMSFQHKQNNILLLDGEDGEIDKMPEREFKSIIVS